MKIRRIQLITAASGVGHGANDGIYPPGGLLTIARAVNQSLPDIKVVIDDQHHFPLHIRPETDLVGIQVASTLCYENSLTIAERAKSEGKIVVIGGPHVTTLHRQIMNNRLSIDFAIRGKGERPFVQLLQVLHDEGNLAAVPSLSWRQNARVIHNLPLDGREWNFDLYTPLPLELLSAGIHKYWEIFKKTISPGFDAAFLLFTHFGCGYRQRKVENLLAKGLPVFQNDGSASFCSFCSLDDPPLTRNPGCILDEIKTYISQFQLPAGAKIHLKCYGDNIGPQIVLVQELAKTLGDCPWWVNYDISWTFYCQSSYLNRRLISLLKQIGTSHLYIGFDGANDQIQARNGLGTSMRTHLNAVKLCQDFGIAIQAGSVVGLAGETPKSLQELYEFFVKLRELGVLERINSAILFIIPGTPAYEMLALREPWIRELDMLPNDLIRNLWIKHFCPQVDLCLLQEYADKIDKLSPGPHASMGFESRLFKEKRRPL